ncbi:metallophosphoesterase [Rhizobium sp. DKSPLA3]|uniref:Metallophosphoesterase n=1 Tax=Rhizobium quercicola TaxID=2901226 RepID=A0A9X1NRT0_9HYPH|nr:metallophosphoesterase [Rhizobium quercicola]MCD7109238.1 metallophosphoesterase [Rhizobium quercicola]
MPFQEFPPIAVIADAHVHDPAADFGFPGAARTGGLSVRPLTEAARSTRVFNESLAAFRTALDDVASRGIRHVVLLGDYTDDGQVATTASVAAILKDYGERHGLVFFALPGNHDIFADAGRHRTKRFLNANGSSAVVTSHPVTVSRDALPPGIPHDRAVTVSPAMFCPGYPDGLTPVAAHGYFPQPSYRHWETPFGVDGNAEGRMFTAVSSSGATRRPLMEASYLVEPVDGLWLLMIDANVFVPIDGSDDWVDSTSAGWNAMLVHKRHVIDWMADVGARAARLGKRLVAFSHYPALDPLDGTRAAEVALLGPTATSGRIPAEAVGEAFIAAGIALHFSGHLHVNDTARMRRGSGFLVNVAVPSLVGFPPAYKILRLGEGGAEIETVSLGEMPMDAAIGALYAAEAQHTGVKTGGMAEAVRYGDFLSAHIGHLAWRRHLKREWPAMLAALLRAATLGDLAGLAVRPAVSMEDAVALLPAAHDRTQASQEGEPAALPAIAFLGDWYRLRMASDAGLASVSPPRLRFYDRLSALYQAQAWPDGSAQGGIAAMLVLFEAYRSGLPSKDFRIDLQTGEFTVR